MFGSKFIQISKHTFLELQFFRNGFNNKIRVLHSRLQINHRRKTRQSISIGLRRQFAFFFEFIKARFNTCHAFIHILLFDISQNNIISTQKTAGRNPVPHVTRADHGNFFNIFRFHCVSPFI